MTKFHAVCIGINRTDPYFRYNGLFRKLPVFRTNFLRYSGKPQETLSPLSGPYPRIQGVTEFNAVEACMPLL